MSQDYVPKYNTTGVARRLTEPVGYPSGCKCDAVSINRYESDLDQDPLS